MLNVWTLQKVEEIIDDYEKTGVSIDNREKVAFKAESAINQVLQAKSS